MTNGLMVATLLHQLASYTKINRVECMPISLLVTGETTYPALVRMYNQLQAHHRKCYALHLLTTYLNIQDNTFITGLPNGSMEVLSKKLHSEKYQKNQSAKNNHLWHNSQISPFITTISMCMTCPSTTTLVHQMKEINIPSKCMLITTNATAH